MDENISLEREKINENAPEEAVAEAPAEETPQVPTGEPQADPSAEPAVDTPEEAAPSDTETPEDAPAADTPVDEVSTENITVEDVLAEANASEAHPAEEGDHEQAIADEIGAYLETQLEDDPDLPEEELPEPAHSGGFFSGNTILFAGRVLLAALLLGIAQVNTIPDGLALVLNLAGFELCALGFAIYSVQDFFYGREWLRGMVFLAITTLAAGTGRFISASISVLLFEVGTGLLDHYADTTAYEASRKLDSLRTHGIDPVNTCIDKVELEVVSESFRRVAYFRAFNRYFVWAILALSVITGVVVPIFDEMDFAKWLYRGATVGVWASFSYLAEILIFLVQEASSKLFAGGIYYKSLDTFDELSSVTSVIMNKTGLITDGKYNVTAIHPIRISEDELLFLAAYAEAFSSHPLAEAIRARTNVQVDRMRIEKHAENRGIGNVVQMGGQIISAGSIELMETLGITGTYGTDDCTSVFVAVGKTFVGRIDFEDAIRPTSAEAVQELRNNGVDNVAMMTGDNAILTTRIGREIGVSEIYSDCLPHDRINRIQYIIDSGRDKNDNVAVVSNDPEEQEALETGDIGVLLRTDASVDDLERYGVDVLIASDDPKLVAEPIAHSKRIARHFKMMWIVSMCFNGLLALVSVFGVLPMWAAITIELLFQTGLMAFGYNGRSFTALFKLFKKKS